MLRKEPVLGKSPKFTWKHLCLNLLSNKLARCSPENDYFWFSLHNLEALQKNHKGLWEPSLLYIRHIRYWCIVSWQLEKHHVICLLGTPYVKQSVPTQKDSSVFPQRFPRLQKVTTDTEYLVIWQICWRFRIFTKTESQVQFSEAECWEVLRKEPVLGKSPKFTWKHLCLNLLSNKLARCSPENDYFWFSLHNLEALQKNHKGLWEPSLLYIRHIRYWCIVSWQLEKHHVICLLGTPYVKQSVPTQKDSSVFPKRFPRLQKVTTDTELDHLTPRMGLL